MRELIESVEAGTLSPVSDGMDMAKAVVGDEFMYVAEAYCGSVDAALALMRAVLPGWTWVGGDMCEGMTVFPPGYDQDPAGHVDAYHADPARALLLAVLKAIEQEKTECVRP